VSARMGRPPKEPGSVKGSTLSIRFTPEERAVIERAAEAAGMSASEWARAALVAAAHTTPI
jgi:uncharacterized protein (DUF1778 family)